MKRYTSRSVDADWITCDVCKGRASIAVKLEINGRYGKKGSRSLGYFCAEHGREKLDRLRKKESAK